MTILLLFIIINDYLLSSQIYQVYIMAHHPTQISSIEKYHKTAETFRRNKEIYNVRKINKLQKHNIIKRRTPIQYYTQSSIQDRICNSFVDSRITQCQKLDKQINKFKARLTISTQMTNTNSNDKFQQDHPPRKQFNILQMDKILSRDYIDSLHNKICHDQRLFNNYKETKYAPNKILEFAKGLSRDYFDKRPSKDNQTIDKEKVGQIYQDLIFKKSAFKCGFSYKIQRAAADNQQLRQRQKSLPIEIDSQCVIQSLLSTQKKQPYCQFYRFLGKEKPSSIDIRYMTSTTNHWIQPQKTHSNAKLFYKKLKTEMAEKRMDLIKKKKNRIFKRIQVCDAKYFSLPKNKREI